MNIRILKDILANEGFPIAPRQCSTDRFGSFRHWKKMGKSNKFLLTKNRIEFNEYIVNSAKHDINLIVL